MQMRGEERDEALVGPALLGRRRNTRLQDAAPVCVRYPAFDTISPGFWCEANAKGYSRGKKLEIGPRPQGYTP